MILANSAVGVEGGGGPPFVEVEEGVLEQGESGLAVHVAGVVVTLGSLFFSHPSGFILIYVYFLITLLGTGTSVHPLNCYFLNILLHPTKSQMSPC